MNRVDIHQDWGSVFYFDDPLDFFKQDPEHWRSLAYERKLLVFKKMTFTKPDYVNFCRCFGRMWTDQEYRYSLEFVETVMVGREKFTISPISNLLTKRLGQKYMPWHSDIPNKKENPFPFRTLWIVKNPNPDSGLTTWLNIEQGLEKLPSELKDQIPDIRIIQQSWYKESNELQEFDFIKTHPVTGKPSLRLNYFCVPEDGITDAWIKKVRYRGEILDPKPVLSPYYKFLETQNDLVYTHRWDDYDIVLYDNWPFVHNRSKLVFDENLERKFYRTNIDHLLIR